MRKKKNISIDKVTNDNSNIYINALGILLFISIFILKPYMNGAVLKICYIADYIILAHDVFYTAFYRLFKDKKVVPNTLISITTLGAMILGQSFEACMVVILFKIGEYLQNLAIGNARKRIESAIRLKPKYANLLVNNEIKVVSPDEIKIDDIILVKKGESVPLDGIIIEGDTNLDMSALTGESKPVNVKRDNVVLSGSINLGEVIKIKVTNDITNSTLSKIITLINEATERKSPTETTLAKFSSIYTPLVSVVSGLIALSPLAFDITWKESWSKGLQVLVVSTPCVLVLSIPLCYFIGIGICGKKGILIKGSNYLDSLSGIGTMVFDKTGTLTKGVFKVVEVVSYGDKYKEEEVLEMIANGEYYSNHYIAKSIISSFNKDIDEKNISDYKEITGKGVSFRYKGNDLLIGNKALMGFNGVLFEEDSKFGTLVHLAVNKKYVGYIVLSDELKKDSPEIISFLKNANIQSVMLTGDREAEAHYISKELGISKHYSGLLPQDKSSTLEEIKSASGGLVAFVGDGINDAPVIAISDVGIAMGKGADLAIETADIILMTDEPSKLIDALKISKSTKSVVKQIIILSVIVKAFFIILVILDRTNLFVAIIGDIAVSLFSVLNCMRIMKRQ